MTTIQIHEEQSNVQEFLDLAVKKFNLNITILDNPNIKIKPKKGKWAEFAEKMSGLTNPKITEHIANTKNNMKESFELRNLALK